MLTYVLVSIGGGFILAIFDVLINANPLGRKIYAPYKPIAREKVAPLLGVIVDIAYSFILAGLYLIIYRALPGPPGLFRALAFGFIVWVLRTLMNSISQWITYNLPVRVHFYTIFAGLIQIIGLVAFYELTLAPLPY